MAIPSQPTSPITLGPGNAPISRSISSEFADSSPHAMSEFYRGGAKVPSSPVNAGVPASGAISLSQLSH